MRSIEPGISRFRAWSGACHRAALRADPLGSSRNDSAERSARGGQRRWCSIDAALIPHHAHRLERVRNRGLVAARGKAGKAELASQRDPVGDDEIALARDAVENEV